MAVIYSWFGNRAWLNPSRLIVFLHSLQSMSLHRSENFQSLHLSLLSLRPRRFGISPSLSPALLHFRISSAKPLSLAPPLPRFPAQCHLCGRLCLSPLCCIRVPLRQPLALSLSRSHPPLSSVGMKACLQGHSLTSLYFSLQLITSSTIHSLC